MIWSTVWIEAVVFTALFTATVMIPTIRHPEIGVHNYPPAGDRAHGQGYAQKWFHVEGMLFPGSLFLVIISVLTGLLVMWVK